MSKYIAYIIDTLNHDLSISKLLNPSDRIYSFLKSAATKCMRRMQSRKNRIANEPEAIKASGSLHFVCISRSELHTIRFLIPKMRRRIPLKSLGLRKDTTFILSPPNKSFCTEPRQTSPAEQPKRPAKIAPGKIGQPKAPHQTQSKSSLCCFPDISQAAPSLRKMERGAPPRQASVFQDAHF